VALVSAHQPPSPTGPPPEPPPARESRSPAGAGVLAGPRAPDPRRELGRLGEALAAAHLERLGFRVLARNVRTRHGEIDLIAFNGRALVFAEVKTRRTRGRQGVIRPDQEPLSALGGRQRARLRRLAAAWLGDHGRGLPTARSIRFDALGVVVDATGALLRLEHVEEAW
jgi:putative endonuclease